MFKGTRKFVFLTILFVLLFSGCAIHRPALSNVQGEIDTELNNSIRANKARTYKPHLRRITRTPSYVAKKALVPKISVPLDDDPSKLQHRFNVSANEMSAHSFFMSLVKDTSYDIVVDPDVKGKISLILNKVTVPEAIKAACESYGLQYVKTDYGYLIQNKKLISRIYRVNYLNIERQGQTTMKVSPSTITDKVSGSSNSSSSGSSSAFTANNASSSSSLSGDGSSVRTSTNNNFWEKLKESLTAIVGDKDGRQVVVNSDSGMIFVKAYPDEQRTVSKYLDSIQQIMDRQVIIEAKILEIHLKAEYQSGIQWRLLGINLNGTTEGTNQQSSLEPFNLSNFYSGSTTPGTDFNMLVQLLNQQGRAEVLSSPHIATLNNQKAIIKVGDDKFFITNVSSTTSGTTTSELTQDVDFTPFFSGIALDVTPEINKDNSVTLQIHPVVSTVVKDPLTYTINQQENEITLAKSTIRESDSIVHAKNGQVVVIGGLMANLNEEDANSVPGVDNTMLKNSFGRQNRQADKIELVILLKPVVVNSDGVWNDKLVNAKREFKKMHGKFMYTVGVGVDESPST